MSNARGIYFNPQHDRPQDWDFLRAWQPNVIRLMLPGSHSDPRSVGVERIERVHDTCPDATILVRCWDVDDRNFEAHDAMVQDPQREAAKQIEWWTIVFARAEAAGVPRDRLMAGLNNETGPEKDPALFAYTKRALELATPRGMRLGVFCFSVGRPALQGEGDYTIGRFAQLDPLIVANRGAIVLHEYMQPEGMYAVWTDREGNERKDYTYLIGRNTRWLVQSPIIIGEWGIDGILYNRHPDPTYGNAGWRNFKADWPPSRYADEYVECIRKANPKVIAICPFISDWSDHKWQSFDMIDAYPELLARKELCVTATAPPHTTHIPQVGTGEPPTEQPPVPSPPMPTSIIDPRVAQAILAVESRGSAFGNDGRVLIRFEAHIFKTYLKNDEVWANYFRTDPVRPWENQEWRQEPSAPWKPIHTGSQADEWAAFEAANFMASLYSVRSINDAAYQSISMGAPQIMGFNHARIGYPSAAAMLKAFESEQMQVLAFINFMLSDPALADAARRKDWREVARRYNGAGNVDAYAKFLQDAYERAGQ